jgi:P27 family predicted phage terminase small subunit
MRRKPDALKALGGTLRRDRARRPRLPSGAPQPRRGLTPLERARYIRLLRLLGNRAGEVDVVILELTASALARHDQASAILAKHGLSYEAKTTTGGTLQRRRPEVDIAADAWRRACRGLVELGLTPQAEQKLDPTALSRPPAAGTPLDAYRAKRSGPSARGRSAERFFRDADAPTIDEFIRRRRQRLGRSGGAS